MTVQAGDAGTVCELSEMRIRRADIGQIKARDRSDKEDSTSAMLAV
jgi:hypothetical protein